MTTTELVALVIACSLGAALGVALAFWAAGLLDRHTEQRRREYWREAYGAEPPLPGESFDEWARRNDR